MDPTSGLTLRRARPDDAETIALFNEALALETEALTLDPARIRRGVAAVLADESKGFYLLAERAGRVIGQLMITYEWSDWRDGLFWWIQSVFVAPEARRGGVFAALHAEIEREARASGESCGIRLYMETENQRARATYESLGMKLTHYVLLEDDFTPPASL